MNFGLFDSSTHLEIGDMVRHPATGHVGLLLGQDATGMWMVEWFAGKRWKVMAQPLRTMEYDPLLSLMAKAEEV
jgi:hypothetical protein|tara:strand:+ start:608 stop:829 length:222 start_codon:yes stop_codon:yes gene_type:complete